MKGPVANVIALDAHAHDVAVSSAPQNLIVESEIKSCAVVALVASNGEHAERRDITGHDDQGSAPVERPLVQLNNPVRRHDCV